MKVKNANKIGIIIPLESHFHNVASLTVPQQWPAKINKRQKELWPLVYIIVYYVHYSRVTATKYRIIEEQGRFQWVLAL